MTDFHDSILNPVNHIKLKNYVISYCGTGFFFSKTNSYAHIYGQVAITPLGTKKSIGMYHLWYSSA